MEALVWFRSDLRLEDNPALRNAFENSEKVHAIFIFSKKQLEKHNEANVKIDFIIKNLIQLEKKLTELNVPLTIIKSDGFDSDASLIGEFIDKKNIDKVFWNNQFGEDETIRDRQVINYLDSKNINVNIFNDQIVYEPGFLKTGQGLPYSVFTPFKRKWIDNFEMDFLDIEYQYQSRKNLNYLSNLKDFDFNFETTHQVNMNLWPAGEDEAEARLLKFLDEKAIKYSKNRNDPILDGTSRISPYLPQELFHQRNVF
jgi:deoxyribodipyrimidine photo-lyase